MLAEKMFRPPKRLVLFTVASQSDEMVRGTSRNLIASFQFDRSVCGAICGRVGRHADLVRRMHRGPRRRAGRVARGRRTSETGEVYSFCAIRWCRHACRCCCREAAETRNQPPVLEATGSARRLRNAEPRAGFRRAVHASASSRPQLARSRARNRYGLVELVDELSIASSSISTPRPRPLARAGCQKGISGAEQASRLVLWRAVGWLLSSSSSMRCRRRLTCGALCSSRRGAPDRLSARRD